MKNNNPPRTTLIHILAFVFLFSATVSSPVFSRDYSDVEIKAIKVIGNVYMLTGSGGNMGITAGPDGVFLIDDQFAPLTKKIRSAIAKISKEDIRFVINTHLHGDHTGGNENMGKGGSVIVAHDNVRKRMSVESFNEFRKKMDPAAPKEALPVITFAEAVTFHLNGEEIYVFHVQPAHTDGDSIVHFRGSNVLHTGDIFFNGFYPYIDIGSGGSVDGLIAAAEQILEIADDETKIIPGHGPLGNRKDLVVYLKVIKKIRKDVAKLIKEGKNLRETLKAKPTAKFDKKWGGGFMNPETFTTIIYKSLSGK